MTGVTGVYRVERNHCPVKVKWRWRDDWKAYDQPIPIGTRVTGVRPQNRPDALLFQMPGSEDFYAASWKCMFAKDDEDITRDEKTYSGWHLSLGLVSWEEKFNYTTLADKNFEVRANTIGLCPGNGYLMRIRDFDLGFTGCLAYAMGFASPTGNGIGNIDYSPRNVKILSLMAGPMALWRPEAGNAAFGLYLPLMPRLALWPQPEHVTVGERIAYLMGAMAEIRIERESWSISQRFGFLGSFSTVAWYFSFNKDFR